MGNKAIDKEYLLDSLKGFENEIINSKYQKKLSAGNGIEIDNNTNTISTPFSVVDGKLCITYYKEES